MNRTCFMLCAALTAVACAPAALGQDQAPAQPGRYAYVDKQTVFDTATGKLIVFEGRPGREGSGFITIDPIKGTVTLRKAKVVDERISDFPNEDLPSFKSPKHTFMTFMRGLRRTDMKMIKSCFGPRSLKEINERRGGLARMVRELRREDDLFDEDLDSLVAELVRDIHEVMHLHEVQPGVWKFETQSNGLYRACETLRTINSCQALYREGDKDQNQEFDYAPNLQALIETRLLDPEAGRQGDYTIEVWRGSEAPEFLWAAIAKPDKPGPNAPYLIMNHSGVIFSSDQAPNQDRANCEIQEGLAPFRLNRR